MKALVPLADGFEEIEAFTVIDVLRRAGVEVTVAGLVSTVVEGSHKIRTMADKRLSDVSADAFDALILPGGPGYKNLANSLSVINLVKDFNKKKKIIGAICGAPVVLAKAGILEDKIATVCPGLESSIPRPRSAKVIVAENIVTSQAPGTAMEFSLKLAEILAGKNTANKLRESLVV